MPEGVDLDDNGSQDDIFDDGIPDSEGAHENHGESTQLGLHTSNGNKEDETAKEEDRVIETSCSVQCTNTKKNCRRGSTTSESAKLVQCADGVKKEEGSKNGLKPSFHLVRKLFCYATCLDWLLMFLGSLASIAHGFVLPIALLILTVITDTFQIHESSRILTNLQLSVPLEFVIRVARESMDKNSRGNSIIELYANARGYEFEGSNIATIDINIKNLTQGVVNCTKDLIFNVPFPYNYTFNFKIENLLKTVLGLPHAKCLNNEEFITEINPLILGLVGVALMAMILGSLQVLLFTITAERQVKKARLLYFNSILRQEREWHDRQMAGELTTKMLQDFDSLHNAIGINLSILIQWVATFFAGLAAAFYSNWEMTLVLVSVMPFIIAPTGIFNRLVATFSSVEQKHYASAGSVAEEVLSSIRTVVAFRGEHQEIKRYQDHLAAAKKIGTRRGLYGGLSLFALNFSLFFSFAAAFWYGGYLVSNAKAGSGDILAVFFSVIVGAFYLGQSTTNMGTLMTSAVTAAPIFDTIDKKSEIDPTSDTGLVPNKLEASVEFANVSFPYPTRPETNVLKSFNLSVKKGECVAIVGASGSGKSTAVALVQRFYDVTDGKVYIGGHDIKDLNVKWLRSHIGTVSQEPALFNTSIRENIQYGKPDATMEEIKQASKLANAHEFIINLPNGYNTIVGEQGSMLSGGQKQRVAIARALIRDPKILLLDEATSALDTENEALLQGMLKNASGERTVILITHRLPLVKCADTVVMVEGGKITWKGTPKQLYSMKGIKQNEDDSEALAFDFEQQNPAVTNMQALSLRRQNYSLMRDQADSKNEATYGDHHLFKKLLALNKKEWWVILLGVIGAGVGGAMFPLFSVMLGGIFEAFVQPKAQVLQHVHPWAGGFVAIAIIAGVSVFVKTLCLSIAGEGLTRRVRLQSFSAMLRQEIGWFDDEKNATGILVSRLSNDARNVQGTSGSRLGTIVETASAIIFAHIISFRYNWPLTLVLMGVIPLYILSGWVHAKASIGFVQLKRKSIQKATERAVEAIENSKTVASLGLEEQFYEEYKVQINKPTKCGLALTPVYGVSQAVLILGYIVAFRFGAFQVTLDENNIIMSHFRDVLKVFTAIVFASVSIGLSSSLAPDYVAAKLSAQKILSLLERKPNPDGFSRDGTKLSNVEGHISLQDVFFRYPSRLEMKVLQNISIKVEPGQTLALVGISGSGKSTLFALLERFYDASSGKIMLDGHDFQDLNIRWLRSKIGVVSQEPVLFDLSVADNIKYGHEMLSDKEVIEAAKAANIHDFITALPQGYATNVGAKGAQLSGGQKQRIAIARALVRKPTILLLDEATSALDDSNEEIVQEALDHAQKGRTSVVITHRLDSVQSADVIGVMKGGRLVEVGNHNELMTKEGEYHRMVRLSNF